MGGSSVDAGMRMLVRHQWVREHGTARVTTLAGPQASSRALWLEWLRLTGRPSDQQRLLEQPAQTADTWMDRSVATVTGLATSAPREPVALLVDAAMLSRWLALHDDRRAAFISEGVVPVSSRSARTVLRRAPTRTSAAHLMKARSLAELTLFEALQATPSTAGRFQLNESVSFHFGSRAAEVDLLSREDDIAIEVDGYHHFTDPESYRRDRRKDLLLQAHGFAVLRFLADDVLLDPRAAVQMVVELLAHRLTERNSRRKPR